MRLVISSLALALAAPALAGAAAAQPVSTQPLAAGEVLLELSAIGTVSSRADTATLNVMVTARGATPTEARAALEALTRRVAGLARANGVGAADIDIRPVTDNIAIDLAVDAAARNVQDAAARVAAEAGDSRPPSDRAAAPPDIPMPGASGSVVIRMRGLARLEALQSALAAIDGVMAMGPNYSLSDTGPARREARTRALATVRADAEAYAAALDMRVVRIARITERSGMDFMSLALSDSSLMRRTVSMGAAGENSDPDIDTLVIVGADFALAPR